MKFILTFKTPDVLDQLDEEQEEIASKFVKYGEYINIEFSKENGIITTRALPK